MKCIIPGTSVRVFAKAIHSMAKIGSELFLEADDDGLSIRTVSSTKSAFALIRFEPNFFNQYDISSNTNDEFANKCKVSMKACSGTFRNIKQVEHCKITIDSANSKLIVQLKCHLETIKTHSISILDFETLQAVYMADNAPNKISASHKLFSEIANNFQVNEEEITLEASSDKLTVKNYVEGSAVDRRFMRSQLSLTASEFNKYHINEETSITFCLREYRALQGFADAINMDLSLNFETAGRPVIFILKNLQTFEANLVMSTLSPDDITNCENTLLNATTKSDHRKRNNDQSEISLRLETTTKKTRHEIDTEESLNDDNDGLFNFVGDNPPESIDYVRANSESNIETQMSLPKSTHGETIQPQLPLDKESEGISITFKDTDDLIDNESVPKSPNAQNKKRTRYIFKRCFESTFNPKRLPGTSQILARNSDTED